jgi:hypothetical protein
MIEHDTPIAMQDTYIFGLLAEQTNDGDIIIPSFLEINNPLAELLIMFILNRLITVDTSALDKE